MPIPAQIFNTSGITPTEAVRGPYAYYDLNHLAYRPVPAELRVDAQVTIRVAPYAGELMTYDQALSASEFEDWFRTLPRPTDMVLHPDGRKRAPISSIECSRDPSRGRQHRAGKYRSSYTPATVALEGIAKFPEFGNHRVAVSIGSMLLHAPNNPVHAARRRDIADPLNTAVLIEL